ncbi:MAG: glycogen synthase GlgA [Nitrospiria bacterium]
MKVLFASSEVFPFAKTGGLADVAGSLPSALARLGHEVKIIMPKYGFIWENQWGLKKIEDFPLEFGGRTYPIMLWTVNLPKTSVEVLFISGGPLSLRDGLYQENGVDYPDNLEGFALFCSALLEVPKRLNWPPDILHVNDWQTSLALAYFKVNHKDDPFYKKTGTVFTVHNLAFQGIFPETLFPILNLPREVFTSSALEFYGKINFLKAGIVFADVITTVSPTYSREILSPEFGCGLEGLIHEREKDLFGILNGADYQKWNPAQDRALPRGYSMKAIEGKKVCKKTLQRKCKFPELEVPLVGIVSRLTVQKGMDLVIDLIEELACIDLQMVILGVGDHEMEDKFKKASENFRDKISVHLTFDENFSHRVIAGSDIFLMPSRFEPCGLGQIYALRYGAIPVVRKTGGLADTIIDATPSNLNLNRANGFTFESATAHSLLNSIRLAICLYQDRGSWDKLVRVAMSAELSWDRSAKEYIKIYQIALDRRK